jgi:predicted MFS family arabinose efflux permease
MSAGNVAPVRTDQPGPALAALTAATFTLGVNGFVMAGVLPAVGRDLGVGVATAGQLVTVFGVVYAAAAPLVAPRAATGDRRIALVAAMGVFTAASAASALAPAFPVLVAARVLAAAAAAAVTPVAVAVARELVPAERAGRAVAGVFGGMTVALVLGVPLGSLVATP